MTVYVDDIITSGSDEAAVNEAYESILQAARTSNFPVNQAKCAAATRELRTFNINFDLHGMGVTPVRLEEMRRVVLADGPGHRSWGIRGYLQTVNSDQAEQLEQDFPRSFPDELRR